MASWRRGALYEVSGRTAVLTLCVLCLGVFQPAVAAPPSFDNVPYVTTLDEKENQRVTLTTLPCSDPDGDTTVVSMPSTGAVTPSSPCGNCFRVLPCDPPDTGYCLIYNPGTLNQDTIWEYTITVQCTDRTDTVTEFVDLRITKNSPPVFSPNQLVDSTTVAGTKDVKAGDVIYDVEATDIDNDNIIYTLTTDPESDFFEIGRGDGIIRAKFDLKSECIDFITFYVTINDGFNTPVGPLTVHATLEGSNQKPDMTNLDITIPVPEDTGRTVFHTIQATDDDTLNKLTYTMTASPITNQDYFGLNGNEIKVAGTLDYETSSLRNTVLTVVASDGFCTSEPRTVRVTVTDVNEPPILTPKDKAYSVYEGPDFGPPFEIDWDIIDEDFVDKHTFEIIGGNSGNVFSVDPDTGQLSVNGNYDIDIPTSDSTSVTLRVEVTDKGGLKSRTSVVLNFLDRNDKYPVIEEADFGFAVCEGKRKGATLGALTCTDDDLTSPNNEVYITGGGNGITVLPGGSIILEAPPALGQTISTSAYCSDRGTYPGPLTSVTPIPISVTTVECPTVTPAPTPAPTDPATTTTAATTTIAAAATTTTEAPSPGNDLDWLEENLWWIILAGLLLTALLALLLYMLWIYCIPYCLTCCRRLRCNCCRRPPPKPRRKVYRPRAVTPVETPREPPPPPAIMPEPYLYDFWKERYPDDDYGNQPDRDNKPRPVTPVLGAEGNGNGNGNAGGNGYGNGNIPQKPGGLNVPPKKNRFCNIL